MILCKFGKPRHRNKASDPRMLAGILPSVASAMGQWQSRTMRNIEDVKIRVRFPVDPRWLKANGEPPVCGTGVAGSIPVSHTAPTMVYHDDWSIMGGAIYAEPVETLEVETVEVEVEETEAEEAPVAE